MLILSRKKGQRVVIGDSVVVTVAEIRSDRVSLAFEAPPEVPIHREEVYDRLAGEFPPAAPLSPPTRTSPRPPPPVTAPPATPPLNPDESFYCPECA